MKAFRGCGRRCLRGDLHELENPRNQPEVRIQSLADPLQGPRSGTGRASLDAADISLIHATALGELGLGEAVALAQLDDLQGDVVGLLEHLALSLGDGRQSLADDLADRGSG